MYKITQPEDQAKFCLPLNRDTEHLYYNTYLVIDANVLTEPRVWQISKINRSNSKGIAIYTCTQELANQHALKADYDNNGNVIAWWADWNDGQIAPVPAVPINDESITIIGKISCSGKQQIKIGGSAKTFTLTYYDEEGNISDYTPGYWALWIDNVRVSNTIVEYIEMDDPHKLKFKFLGDDSYIGKILKIKNTSGEVTAELDVEIIAL